MGRVLSVFIVTTSGPGIDVIFGGIIVLLAVAAPAALAIAIPVAARDVVPPGLNSWQKFLTFLGLSLQFLSRKKLAVLTNLGVFFPIHLFFSVSGFGTVNLEQVLRNFQNLRVGFCLGFDFGCSGNFVFVLLVLLVVLLLVRLLVVLLMAE